MNRRETRITRASIRVGFVLGVAFAGFVTTGYFLWQEKLQVLAVVSYLLAGALGLFFAMTHLAQLADDAENGPEDEETP